MAPKFRPLQWVIIMQDKTKYLGKIIGAQYEAHDTKGEWIYTITYGKGSPLDAKESEITHYIDDNDVYFPVNK
jgi:hypothetical protein